MKLVNTIFYILCISLCVQAFAADILRRRVQKMRRRSKPPCAFSLSIGDRKPLSAAPGIKASVFIRGVKFKYALNSAHLP